MVDIPRIIFLGMTKSLGKRAFSDSLLEAVSKRKFSYMKRLLA